MKTALRVVVAGFPYQLLPSQTKTTMPIPAVNFTEAAPSLKKIFISEINIYVTPDTFLVTKFREMSQKTKLRLTSATESKHWLGRPKIKYWPQQFNFAVFRATQGCGISGEVFDTGLTLLPQIRACYKFN